MATIAELRAALRVWLQSQMRIDVWSANPPTSVATSVSGSLYPANTGLEAPIRGFSIAERFQGSVKGSVVIPFAVTYRFDKDLAYHRLPIDQAEILASSIALTATQVAGCIQEDIQKIEFESYDPVEVAKFEQPSTPAGKDWLMILYFPFKVFGVFEAGVSGINGNTNDPNIEPPYDLQQLDVGIWRSKIGKVEDPLNSTLDKTLTLTDPTP